MDSRYMQLAMEYAQARPRDLQAQQQAAYVQEAVARHMATQMPSIHLWRRRLNRQRKQVKRRCLLGAFQCPRLQADSLDR